MKKIIYVQYTNPACYPPLEHSSHILADSGWKVLFLGTWDFTGRGINFSPHINVVVQRIPFCQRGWLQKIHYFLFCLWVFTKTLIYRPKWIYASDPLSSPIALLLTYIPGLKIIYHEHDSPGKNSDTSLFLRCILKGRVKLSRRADLCILPNEKRAQNFRIETRTLKQILVVKNFPLKKEVKISRRENKKGLCVVYHGSIGPSRLPLAVVSVLTKLPAEVSLRVIGYETVGYKNYIKKLKETASSFDVVERFEFIGKLSTRQEVLRYCRDCDIGIAFMPKISGDINEQAMVYASNKPFDYLASGMALLVSDLPDWKEIYVKPGYGLACNPEDSESIAGSLRWFLEHPLETRQMGEAGRQRILQDWNYERQFEPVLKILTEG
ncbi:MAG: glycosyltransferase [Candidatus Omnitrophica bacterium]|nr:glycosyltransferase [Candidatus Omnitrophota bacterium]